MPGESGHTVDRGRRPAAGPAPTIQLPTYRRARLENGLGLLVVRHDDLPEMAARLVLPYGAADDPEGRNGTGLLVARALTEGTAERGAREVAEELDYLGAGFSIDVGHDASVLRFDFLSRVFGPALELFAEILAAPAFDPTEVDRLKDERLDEIASGLDEPRVVARLRLSEAIFGDHPYGLRVGGTEDTVRAIDAAILQDYHRRFYRPAAATLILVGDVPESAELRERLSAAFGRWSGDRSPGVELLDPQAPAERRLWAVNWAGPQSEIRVGGVGIARKSDDYFAVMVMNAVLGGLFSSRINMNLREDKGWTYGAHTRFDTRKRRGPFYAATAVDAEATVDAVGEILGEMERMKSEPPDDQELELAKSALTLSLPRMFETVSQVAGRIADQVVHDLPDDYWETYRDRMAAVDADAVRAAAERYLSTDDGAVVVVGPVEERLEALGSLGRVERRDIRGRPVGD